MQKLTKKYELLVEDTVVNHGDIIHIDGERRRKFMFMYRVINEDSGVEWIDCIELMKGNDGPFRSFRPDKVRPMKGSKRGKG